LEQAMSQTETATALPPETKRALTALIIGAVAAVLDTTIVSIALRTLAGALHSTVSQIQWVSTGYLLALGVAASGTATSCCR
jgi:MFS family permease